MKMDKLHFLLSAAESDFFKFKGQVPFKLKKKYPAAKHYTDFYRLELLFTHLSFRWTVPLMFNPFTHCTFDVAHLTAEL